MGIDRAKTTTFHAPDRRAHGMVSFLPSRQSRREAAGKKLQLHSAALKKEKSFAREEKRRREGRKEPLRASALRQQEQEPAGTDSAYFGVILADGAASRKIAKSRMTTNSRTRASYAESCLLAYVLWFFLSCTAKVPYTYQLLPQERILNRTCHCCVAFPDVRRVRHMSSDPCRGVLCS